MSFTLSNGVITQTGTDTDLSGLSSISGVTTFTTQHKIFYTLDATIIKLVITGTLSYDPDFECLIFQDVTDNGTVVVDGGVFTMGVVGVVNGITRYSTGDALVMPNDNGGLPDERALVVTGGGQFIMNGGTIYHGNANGVRNGTATINKGRFVLTSLDNESIQYFRIESGGSMDVFDVEIDSLRPLTAVQILFAQNGISQFSGSLQCCALQNRTGAHNGPLSLRNITLGENASTYDFLITGNALADYRSQATEVRNVDIGTDFNFEYADANSTAHIAIYQEVSFKVLDIFQAPIENAKVRIQTTNSGNRINPGTSPKFINFIDYTTGFDSYEQTTDAQGNTVLFEVLTGRIWDEGAGGLVEDLYSISQTKGVDNFPFKYISYNHNLANSVGIFKSNKALSFEQILVDDENISETDMSIVDAYTEIDTANKFYDRAKSFLYNNYSGETNTIVRRIEDTIDAGSYNIVVDNLAPQAFAFDGTTITINATVFTGNLRTTATVSFLNDATIDGVIFDTNGDSNLSVTVPTGYENDIDVYISQADAEDEVNQVATGSSFRYNSAVFGGQTLWFRMTQADGSYIIENYLVPAEAGIYDINLVVTSENAALGSIKSVTDKLDSMIEIIGGNQAFTTQALQNIDTSSLATSSELSNAVTSIKGAEDRDLTEVFNNTPSVDLAGVALESSVQSIQTKVDTLENTDLTGIATTADINAQTNTIVTEINENQVSIENIDIDTTAIVTGVRNAITEDHGEGLYNGAFDASLIATKENQKILELLSLAILTQGPYKTTVLNTFSDNIELEITENSLNYTINETDIGEYDLVNENFTAELNSNESTINI